MGAGCRGIQKILEPGRRQKSDKKEQLFVKGNLRQAQSSGPNPRLVWSQGRGPPKVRDSRGRLVGALGPTLGWVPSPMGAKSWCPIPLPGPSPLLLLPLFSPAPLSLGLLPDFPLSMLRPPLTHPSASLHPPFLVVILVTFPLNSRWHVHSKWLLFGPDT